VLAMDLVPTEELVDRRSWTIGELTIRATREPAGWRVERSDSSSALLSAEPPRLRVGPGTGLVVASMETPLLVPKGSRVELWLSWPLSVEAVGPQGDVLDTWRPGLRRTLFGSVSDGRVEPALRCATLSSPLDNTGPIHAALHVQLESHSDVPVTLRRFPVDESVLALASTGAQHICGTLRVRIRDPLHADVETEALPARPGFTPLPRPPAPTLPGRSASLSWLLDSTRRSVEFQL